MSAAQGAETGRVIAAFAVLRDALDEMRSEEARSLLRDVLRDALDRDAAQLGETGPTAIIAGTWTLGETFHAGRHFRLDRLRHRDLGTRHLLKHVAPDHAGDPLYREMLLREGAHQSRIHHPAVLPVQAILRLADGRPGLVLPYCEGGDLGKVLRGGGLDAAALPSLLLRLCDGLAAIHDAGLVHGDLTPANILLPGGDPSKALICDFGLSAEIGAIRAGFDELGTPGFVPPECADPHAPCAPEQDLFALGRVIQAVLDAVAFPDAALRGLAAALQSPDPAERPTLGQVMEQLDRDRRQ